MVTLLFRRAAIKNYDDLNKNNIVISQQSDLFNVYFLYFVQSFNLADFSFPLSWL